jgi:hypothetical protein
MRKVPSISGYANIPAMMAKLKKRRIGKKIPLSSTNQKTAF